MPPSREGAEKMDGDTDRGGEDRRRDFLTLLSVKVRVINGLSPALLELKPDSRPNTYKNTDTLMSSTPANTHKQEET